MKENQDMLHVFLINYHDYMMVFDLYCNLSKDCIQFQKDGFNSLLG